MTIDALNEHIYDKFQPLLASGARRFDFMGGRRSGKTYFIMQFLLNCIKAGDRVNVATMTAEQGRLGAYQDARDIIGSSEEQDDFVISKSPRQIEHVKGGVMFFNSYQDSETAKGIQCDWLYINEANNFTEQQYIDLSASVRKGVIADRNPNSECWTERNGFALIHSTWQDNADNLTEQQREWFEQLKAKAESPTATSADVAFYRMYYLGEYAEITGDIFTPANIHVEHIDETQLKKWCIFADPSNMTGNDYFATIVCATDGRRLCIMDAWSRNQSEIDPDYAKWPEWQKRWACVIEQWEWWRKRYGAGTVLAEGNGVGADFARYAAELWQDFNTFNSTGNKHRRITDNYDAITQRVVFNDTPGAKEFVRQIWEYAGKDVPGVHDDNVDVVSTAWDYYHKATAWI